MARFILFLMIFTTAGVSSQIIRLPSPKAEERKIDNRHSDQVFYPGPTYRPKWVQYPEDRTTTNVTPISTSSNPVSSTSNPVSSTSESVSSTSESVSFTSKPTITSTSKPITTTPKSDSAKIVIPEDSEEDDDCVLTATPPARNSTCCGIDARIVHRIVGSKGPALIEEHPWLVQLEYEDDDKYNERENVHKRLCGGFLISGRYVVTAAHCVVGEVLIYGRPVNVILGEYDTKNEGPDCTLVNGIQMCTDGAIKVSIESIIVHPKHLATNRSIHNDIALVRLSKTVEFTNFIRPICLPTFDITESPPQDLRLFTTGWGAVSDKIVEFQGRQTTYFKHDYESDGIKRYVDVPYVPHEECKERYKFVNQGHICAGSDPGKDACRGDSGGPLMYVKDDVYEAVGLVSTGFNKYPCGTEGVPGLYTRLFPFVTWIKDNIKP